MFFRSIVTCSDADDVVVQQRTASCPTIDDGGCESAIIEDMETLT
jgi:hypothetical protein